MPLHPGDVFAGFTIERELGAGGMGEVYLARHPRLPRRVALKLLRNDLVADTAFVQRFQREAEIVAGLDHRAIVPIDDCGSEDGRFWFSMRFIDGITADQALAAEPDGLDPDRAVRIIERVASALDFAHRRNLVHRDVKPANILLSGGEDEPEQVFLSDFGVAKGFGELEARAPALTATGGVVATVDYAAPEQIEARPLDGRCDVYALGCVLFKLLTGRLPYPGETLAAKVFARMSQPAPLPTMYNPSLPVEFNVVIGRALERDRELRYQTCRELAVAARAVLTGSVTNAGQNPSQGSDTSTTTTLPPGTGVTRAVSPTPPPWQQDPGSSSWTRDPVSPSWTQDPLSPSWHPEATQQAWSAAPPAGYPQQGHPQQAGHPQPQSQPQQGHPQQPGHPQGHPQQGHPQQGHPQQPLPPQSGGQPMPQGGAESNPSSGWTPPHGWVVPTLPAGPDQRHQDPHRQDQRRQDPRAAGAWRELAGTPPAPPPGGSGGSGESRGDRSRTWIGVGVVALAAALVAGILWFTGVIGGRSSTTDGTGASTASGTGGGTTPATNTTGSPTTSRPTSSPPPTSPPGTVTGSPSGSPVLPTSLTLLPDLPQGPVLATNTVIVSTPMPGGFALRAVNTDDGTMSTLGPVTKSSANPQISPDRRSLVYLRDNALWTAGSDGTDERKLFETPAMCRSIQRPGWSAAEPDKLVLPCTTPDRGPALLVTDFEGEVLYELDVGSLDVVDDVSVSPDGSTVLFWGAVKTTDRMPGSGPLWTMPLDVDGEPTRIREESVTDALFSPDGSKIAARVSDDGQSKIAVMNADGSDLVFVSGGGAQGPAWSPDGTQIAFKKGRDGQDILMVTSPDGNTEQIVGGDGIAIVGSPAWGPR